MAADIRSFFGKQARSKKAAPVIPDDDGDDFKAQKVMRRRDKRILFIDSSDEETEGTTKKSKKIDAASTLKTTSANDFFGSAPIKRSEPPPIRRSTRKLPSKQASPDVILESPTTPEAPVTDKKPSMDLIPPAKKLKMLIEKCDSKVSPAKQPKTQTLSKRLLKTPPKGSLHTLPKRLLQTPPKRSLQTPPKRTSPRKKMRSATPPVSEGTTPLGKRGVAKPQDKKGVVTPEEKKPVIKQEKQSSTPSFSVPKPSRTASYRAYLDREGPKAPGSKEIPKGSANCLLGLTFVFTGVGESLDREECAEIAKQYGAKVTTGISKKTSYLVVGEGAGESKTAKAKQLGTKIIDEDDFLDLIRTRSSGSCQAAPTTAGRKESAKPVVKSPSSQTTPSRRGLDKSQTKPQTPQYGNETTSSLSQSTPTRMIKGADNLMWVDRHSPMTTNQIIGQKGERSNVRKLAKWLREWFEHHEAKSTRKQHYSKGKEDGSIFKAALLSGPPGVGKTTSATLVCKEEGFTYTEMNASASRGKKTLQAEVASSLDNLSMDAFLTGGGGVESGKRHVLIMDEVDGMSGNEDRGGMQELIQLIKKSSIPIICICNDRQHMKIRSLANHCYDLRFPKPKVEQIKGSMMSIAFKEGVKIDPHALQEIILACNNDIRQVLHHLSLWTIMDKTVGMDDAKKAAKKQFKMSPYDVVRRVFCPMSGDREMSLNEKAGLFFTDYSFGPLFVQENYLRVKCETASCTKELLQRMSDAAEAIAKGDLVSKIIRAESQWGLLPIQAMYSSVLPGEYMRGNLGMPEFPQWLGNNSKQGKSGRILNELQQHTRLNCSCDRTEFGMEYLPVLHDRLTRPLLEQGAEGVGETVSLLEAYDMTREDWDSVTELARYSGRIDITSKIDSKTKAAFTRAYNKSSHPLPYQRQMTGSSYKKKARGALESVSDEAEGIEEDEERGNSLSDSEGEEGNKTAEVFFAKPKKSLKGSTTSSKKGGKGKKRK